MKSRPPLLARLWRKLFPAAPQPPVRLSSKGQPLPKRDRVGERGIEPLEGRIAPAVLLPNGMDVQYKDLDGDLVTIHFSKSLFTAPASADIDATLASVFKFSTGKAHTGAADAAFDAPQQLQLIDLTKVRPNASVTPATGVSFTVTAKQVDSDNNGTLEGDGRVNVGAISASGIALGSITIGGDLGQIDAGLSTAKTAITALNVKTLGALTNTQAGTANYESAIVGGIGAFTADSIVGGYLHVSDAPGGNSGTAAVGNIGTVTIAHQIAARDAANASATNDGRLEVSGNIGTLSIGSAFRDAAHPETTDGLFGGAGASSGTVKVGGTVTKLLIKGDLRGSTGTSSASIDVDGQVTSLQVAGTLLGSGTSSASITAAKLGTVIIGTVDGHGAAGTSDGRGIVGGAGDGSGVVTSESTIASATITNIQGSGPNSGGLTARGAITSVTVNGYVKGGAGQNSGFIHSDTSLGTVKLLGNLEGGAGAQSGVISSANFITSFSGTSILGADSTVPGSGLDSAGISAAGKIGTVTLTGSLIGGFGEHSGYIDSDYSIASIIIKGDMEGRSGHLSGSIVSASTIGTVNITGHLKGGAPVTLPAVDTTPAYTNPGDLSGSITTGTAGFGGITSLTVTQGIIGGAATSSGVISTAGDIGTLRMSPNDGNAITGGAGDSSGVVYSFGKIGTASISGYINGGAGVNSGSIQEHGLLGSLTVVGVVGGTGEGSGSVLALDSGTPGGEHAPGGMGTVFVGRINGGDGLRSGVVSSDGAIKSLTTSMLLAGGNATSGRIVSGAGLYAAGNIGTLSLGLVGVHSLAQNGFNGAGGSVLVYGAVGTLKMDAMYQGTIHVADSIGSLSVGSLPQHNEGVYPGIESSTITAGGQAVFNGKTDLAIGSITIYGDVKSSSIKAGYGVLNDAENGHAQIGAVKVTGGWLSSNLVAGVQDAGAAGFGDAGDQLISGNSSTVKARIASVMITGNIDGSAGGQFGFVAQEIGSFKSSRGTLALNPTAGQFFSYAGSAGSTVSIREVLPVV